MKVTDDPRIIASHPAPRAAVGLRAASPFGLLARPGGAAIGGAGRAALDFAQRSLAPLRYPQQELTWLDSFRLGRAPSRIQPWRRRRSAPSDQVDLGQPAAPAEIGEATGESAFSPLPLVRSPLTTGAGRLARTVAARLAAAPSVQPSWQLGNQPQSADGDPPSAGGGPLMLPFSPIDHPARLAADRLSAAENRTRGYGSAAPLNLIQPLRSGGTTSRADQPYGRVVRIQRASQSSVSGAGSGGVQARTAEPASQPIQGTAGADAGQTALVSRPAPDWSEPIEWPTATGAETPVRRTPLARLPLLERHPSAAAFAQPVGTDAPPLVAGAQTGPTQWTSGGANPESSPTSALIARMTDSAPAIRAVPTHPARQSQGAISRAWAGAAAAQPSQPPRPARSGSAGLALAVPAAGISDAGTPDMSTSVIDAWVQPLRSWPAPGAQTLPVIHRQRRHAADQLRTTDQPAESAQPDQRPGDAGAIRRAVEARPIVGERPSPTPSADTGAAEQAARRTQPTDYAAVPPAPIGRRGGSAAWSSSEGGTAKPALILRQPLITTHATPPTILGRHGVIGRLAGAWLAPADRAPGSAQTAGASEMDRAPSNRLPLISPIQRSGLAASSVAGGEHAQRGITHWRAGGRTGARDTSAAGSADIDRVNRLVETESMAAAPARPRDRGVPLDIPLANRSWPALMRWVDPASFGAGGGAGTFAAAPAPLAWVAPIGPAEGSPPDAPGRVRRTITAIPARSAPQTGDFAAAGGPAPGDRKVARLTETNGWTPIARRQEWTPGAGPALARSVFAGLGPLVGHEFGAAASGRSVRPASQLGPGQTWLRPLQRHTSTEEWREQSMVGAGAAAPGTTPAHGTRKFTVANREIRRSADWTTAIHTASAAPTPTEQPARASGGTDGLPGLAGGQAAQPPLPLLTTLPTRSPETPADHSATHPASIAAALPSAMRSTTGRETTAPLSLIQPIRLRGILGAATPAALAGQIDQRQAERPTGGLAPTWTTPGRATLPPLAFIQPARLGGFLGAATPAALAGQFDQRQAERPIGGIAPTWTTPGRATLPPLAFIQPARLGGFLGTAATPAALAGQFDQRQAERPIGGLAPTWTTPGRATLPPLAFIQPARLGGVLARRYAEQADSAPESAVAQASRAGSAGSLPMAGSTDIQPSAAPLRPIQPFRLAGATSAQLWLPWAGDQQAASADRPWPALQRATVAPLAFIQPARLQRYVKPHDSLASPHPLRGHPAPAQWRGAGGEVGNSRPSDVAKPLLIPPARLAMRHADGRATADRAITRADQNLRFSTTAGLDQPRRTSGGAAASSLAFIQPQRLQSHVAARDSLTSPHPMRRPHVPSQWSGDGGEVDHPRLPSEFTDTLILQPARLPLLARRIDAGASMIAPADQGSARLNWRQRAASLGADETGRSTLRPASELAWMAPLARSSAPGVAAQSLASGLIHRFSAGSAESAEPAALELLRPGGAEQVQPGGALGGRGAQAAPSLDLLQPMREYQSAPALQRVLEDDEAASGASAAARPEADIEALARQVYARLRRRLKIDAERLGH